MKTLFTHVASEKAIIREMDMTELEILLPTLTDPQLIKYVKEQMAQLSKVHLN